MRSVFSTRLAAAALATAFVGFLCAAEPVAVKAPAPVVVALKEAGPTDEKAVRALLKQKSKVAFDGLTVREFLATIAVDHGLTVRLDLAAFKRFQPDSGAVGMVSGAGNVFVALQGQANPDEIQQFLESKLRLPHAVGTTLADLLSDLCAQMPGKCAYRIRHNQVVIGPAFLPPVVPGSGASPSGGMALAVSPHVLTEQLLGEPVSVAIDDKPLTEAILELRKITGANIVLDARCKEKAKLAVSGSFDDARLLTALELLADMCDLKVVSSNNVFYITGVENAAKMQKQVHRDLFGEPEAVAPVLVGEPKK